MPTSTVPITDEISFLILYLQARGCERWGYVGYKCWGKLIRFATGKTDSDDIRKVWQSLYATGRFTKKKVKTRTEYQFSYNEKPGS
tara:strand:+ start:8608 stop:8865 length:258 start_codon:yes stop_codon:yes gene_type:complete